MEAFQHILYIAVIFIIISLYFHKLREVKYLKSIILQLQDKDYKNIIEKVKRDTIVSIMEKLKYPSSSDTFDSLSAISFI